MPHREQEPELDPVCGMMILPGDAAGHADYNGHTYYFCSEWCLEQFQKNPAPFLEARPAIGHAAPADLEADYTCPMHPEMRQKGPGSCPICGMALEPVTVSLEEQPNEELDDMTRRFWWSLALTLPVLAFMVSEFLPGHPIQQALSPRHAALDRARAGDAGRAVGRVAVLRARLGLGRSAVILNMFTLIALGVGAAYGFSVVATMAPGLFPHSFHMHGGVAVYFRAGSGHRRARAARSGARAARAKPDERGDSKPARARAQRRRGA